MNQIFDVVYRFLLAIADLTGFTYREINIIVYFFIIPIFYLNLIDNLFGKHYFKLGFCVLCGIATALIPSFERFSSKLFDYSVVFLNWFGVFGWSYIEASVIICVVVPVVIYVVLLYFVRKKQKRNFLWFKFQEENREIL